MTDLHIFLIALIQGITEFLPVSSSGHLAILPLFTTLTDQGRAMDVAAHVGTLLAVLIYFWRDTKGLTLAGLGSLGIAPARRALQGTPYIQLFWALVIGTLPIVMVGFLANLSGVLDLLRTPLVIGLAFIGFGVLLYWADRRPDQQVTADDPASMGVKVPLKSALLIGFGQIFALIPGASRAGVTMTAARALGMGRNASARFSMLLSIPAIIASGALTALSVKKSGENFAWLDALLVAGLSFGFALLGIHFLLSWLKRASMTLFVVYRLILGTALLALWYQGLL